MNLLKLLLYLFLSASVMFLTGCKKISYVEKSKIELKGILVNGRPRGEVEKEIGSPHWVDSDIVGYYNYPNNVALDNFEYPKDFTIQYSSKNEVVSVLYSTE